MNGHVRRIFSLQDFVVPVEPVEDDDEDYYDESEVKFLPKEQLMEKLEDFDNLVNAMGALFYASKRMTTQVPCVFEAWKDFVFEKQADKIHELLSTGNSVTSPNKSEIKSFEATSKMVTGGPAVLVENTASPLLAEGSPSDMQV